MTKLDEIVVDVEKGLILEVTQNNYNQICLVIRKAKEGEKQQKIDGHFGYKAGIFTRYFFDR